MSQYIVIFIRTTITKDLVFYYRPTELIKCFKELFFKIFMIYDWSILPLYGRHVFGPYFSPVTGIYLQQANIIYSSIIYEAELFFEIENRGIFEEIAAPVKWNQRCRYSTVTNVSLSYCVLSDSLFMIIVNEKFRHANCSFIYNNKYNAIVRLLFITIASLQIYTMVIKLNVRKQSINCVA